MMNTANLVFSEPNHILQKLVDHNGGIDRAIHHFIIPDRIGVESYRTAEAYNHHELQQDTAKTKIQESAKIAAIGRPKQLTFNS